MIFDIINEKFPELSFQEKMNLALICIEAFLLIMIDDKEIENDKTKMQK